MTTDAQLLRLPSDRRGRVSLVPDGRRVLASFTPAEAVAVLTVLIE